MFDEEFTPKKSDSPKPRILDDLSVTDMQDYIDWLASEIERVKLAIQKRGDTRSAADAFFQ